ncbi:hypothetical protein Moror_2214 [Moniliophthora roreri MCA 2997]|uniref:G protein-coupled receptor n=1 Tax=Moniliophthora roreri (strain MCA 2997) TaxID=1381753 RepID=V2W6B4_MONRO|nr:hypothetical protein Moror_2214 [Moniliophthora roreri MCA 2997]
MNILASLTSRYFFAEHVIVYPLATLSVMFFAYGFYILLFGISLVSLYQRRDKMDKIKLYVGCNVFLFIIASIGTAATTAFFIYRDVVTYNPVRSGDLTEYNNYTRRRLIVNGDFQDIMPILANVAADLLLIHRCYLIWNSPKPLAYTLIFLSVSLNAIGLSSTIVIAIGNHHLYSATNGRQLYTIGNSIVNAYLIAHTVFNGILTVMTAGRIWWITREVRLLMDREMSHKYTGIIAMILESGALYPTFAIAYLIIDATIDPQHTDIRPINLGPLIVLSAAISPTLIIVRAAVGKTVNTVDQVISTLQFAGGNEIRGEGMFERESSEQEKAAV